MRFLFFLASCLFFAAAGAQRESARGAGHTVAALFFLCQLEN